MSLCRHLPCSLCVSFELHVSSQMRDSKATYPQALHRLKCLQGTRLPRNTLMLQLLAITSQHNVYQKNRLSAANSGTPAPACASLQLLLLHIHRSLCASPITSS